MTEQLSKAKQETEQIGAAQKRRTQFKKMNTCIGFSSSAIAIYLGRECQTTECWKLSPGYNFVWLFALAVMVGMLAEFYFVWLEEKEGKP